MKHVHFVTFDGVFINLDNVNVVRKRFNKDCVSTVHDDNGEAHDVIKGKPYEIQLDFGSDDVLRMRYDIEEVRDRQYERFNEILMVKQGGAK